MTDDDAILPVAINLRAIIALAPALEDQAVARSNHHEIPGGPAMVYLGPVANPTDRQRRGELIEADWLRRDGDQWCKAHETLRGLCAHRLNPWVDEDGVDDPLTALRFWTEIHRMEEA